MNRFISFEALSRRRPTSLLARPLPGAVITLVIVFLAQIGQVAAAGIINGNFQTGDLTGWDANALISPLSTPATVDVTTVGASMVGEVYFSSSVGGHYAGSLSQDFYTGTATKLKFDIGFAASAQVTPGELNIVDTMDVLVQNLDANTTIVHTLHAENQPGESSGTGLNLQTNGLPIHASATLPGIDTHVRLALLIDFHTLDGVPSSGQLLLDNVTLVPEPTSLIPAAIAGLLAWGWRRWR